MDNHYFNYSTYIAEYGWEYRRFLQKWRQLCATDKRWPPLHYRQQALLRSPNNHEHLARYDLRYIHLEALPQRKSSALGGILLEQVVAAAILAIDPRTTDGTGQLMLLHCANDEESLDRLLAVAQEELAHRGGYRLVGPTAPSPHLIGGVLDNYFHITPPLHTPYNPPYTPELMASSLTPWQNLTLSQIQLPRLDGGEKWATSPSNLDTVVSVPGKKTSVNLELLPLTGKLALSEPFLPLWQEASPVRTLFPLPDLVEARFMWAWLTAWPWAGWVVIVDKQPVGFALLQPDLAAANQVANGGRNPFWAWWLRWRVRRPSMSGRLLYGSVLPEWHGEGITELLWQQVIHYAQQQGWHSLTVGPHLAKADLVQGRNFGRVQASSRASHPGNRGNRNRYVGKESKTDDHDNAFSDYRETVVEQLKLTSQIQQQYTIYTTPG